MCVCANTIAILSPPPSPNAHTYNTIIIINTNTRTHRLFRAVLLPTEDLNDVAVVSVIRYVRIKEYYPDRPILHAMDLRPVYTIDWDIFAGIILFQL